jgi:hypothetical protein
LENEIKSKKDYMINLKYDNTNLNNIQNIQDKALKEITQNEGYMKEVERIVEKVKRIKAENKCIKDILKSQETKLKKQNQYMIFHKNKNIKIRENIEFKKKIKQEVKN